MFGGAVEAYDKFVGRYGVALAHELTRFAGVEAGMRALDVGCGPGALTRVLADRLGAGNVAAVEPSEPFAAACRTRAPGVEVLVATAESLPFAEGAFDAVFSQLVINFMTNPSAGVAEMKRVTTVGGVVASCVWDYAGEMKLLRAFWDAATEVKPASGSVADEGVVMPNCTQESLGSLWGETGLTSVRTGALTVSAGYQSFEDLWSPFPTGVGPAGAFCASLDPDTQDDLRAAFRHRLDIGAEPFELSARAWAVVGTVAG